MNLLVLKELLIFVKELKKGKSYLCFKKIKWVKFKFKMQMKQQDMLKGFSTQCLQSKWEVNVIYFKLKYVYVDLFTRSLSDIKCWDSKIEDLNFPIPKVVIKIFFKIVKFLKQYFCSNKRTQLVSIFNSSWILNK